MKTKAFYLVILTALIVLFFLSSCEKEEIFISEPIVENPVDTTSSEEPTDTSTIVSNPGHTYTEGIIGENIEITNYIIPSGKESIHLSGDKISNSPSMKSASLKSSPNSKSFKLSYQNENGELENLSIKDGSISFDGVTDIISLPNGYSLLMGEVTITEVAPVYNYYLEIDTVDFLPDDISENNVIEVFDSLDMTYYVYLDTTTLKVDSVETFEYFNNLICRGNSYHSLGEIEFSDRIFYEANSPFRVDKEEHAFYFVKPGSYIIMKVDLRGKSPKYSELYNPSNYPDIELYSGFYLMGNDNLVLDCSSTKEFFISSNGNVTQFGDDLSPMKESKHVIDDKYYFTMEDTLYVSQFEGDDVMIEKMGPFGIRNLSEQNHLTYRFDYNNEIIFYNTMDEYFVIFDKKSQKHFEVYLDGTSGWYPEEESGVLASKSKKDDIYFYNNGKLLKYNKVSKILKNISEEYSVKEIASTSKDINFYAKKKSNGKNLRCVINPEDDSIEEVEELVSEDNFIAPIE
jgi:hypothetical protein